MPVTVRGPADGTRRDQLASLRALLVLSMLMTESGDEGQILQLATTAAPSLARCEAVGVCAEGGWHLTRPPCTDRTVRRDVEAQLDSLGTTGGAVKMEGESWAWAYALHGGGVAHVIVRAERALSSAEQFLLRALAQQTGAALANARLHARERANAEELQRANLALEETVGALEATMGIHARLTRVAVAGEGQDAIAGAVHELTGHPVAIEDRFGNLRAWAGPDRPDPYPKPSEAQRERMLRRALREGRPIRDRDRLVAVASPRGDTVGILALIDPSGTASNQDLVALEHGATVLAMELARLRSVAETELRLRRDLVEELLAGTDEDSALARAQALGYDLERPHRVVVVEGRNRTGDEEAVFRAVRRAARDLGVGSLVVARRDHVVVLAHSELSWDGLREAVLTELGGGGCRIGVGGGCRRPSDVPRSHREAGLALRLQHVAGAKEGVTVYDDLGIYEILSHVDEPDVVDRFVRRWLGPLVDYDDRKGSDLVATLTRYLECGGHHAATAAALTVHRSTLKYRLQRIRELLGRDISDADTRFNLQLATRAWQVLQALRR